MLVTQKYSYRVKYIKFTNLRPTYFFFKIFFKSYNIVPNTSNQRLTLIRKSSLIRLL